MVRLKNIKRQGNIITLDVLIEGCKQALPLVFNIAKQDFEPHPMPKGYEHCLTHIAKARTYLRETVNSGGELPEVRAIVWY